MSTDHFDADVTTLRELQAYSREQDEQATQLVALDQKRRAYVDRLVLAAGGDESVTWAAAHALLPHDPLSRTPG